MQLTPAQIASITTEHPIPPLMGVTVEDIEQALCDYVAYTLPHGGPLEIDPHRLARRLCLIIQQTRAGVTCLGCKMGVHPR